MYKIYEQGKGVTTFLFLHYFGGSALAWQQVTERLGDGVRLVTVDLRGFGAATATDAAYTMREYANDVAEILAASSVDRYVLVGHSMGGKIALRFAMRQPPGLAALVLLAPSPPTPEPIAEAERARLLAGYGDEAASLQTLHGITAHPLPADLLRQAVSDSTRSSAAGWRAWLQHGSREDLSAEMWKIDAPTFVLSGAADTAIAPAIVEREVVSRIAGAQMIMLPDAGHLLPLEAPGAVAALLQRVVEMVGATKV